MDKFIDNKFMVKIIGDICTYAISNGIKPDDMLETVAENILLLLELGTFNNWTPEEKSND